MVSRRNNLNDSSLELLLDTICNTFGGVLFLAMLISLLLTQTSKRSELESAAADPLPAMSAADLVRMQARIEDLERDLAQLRASTAAAETMAAQLVEADAREKIQAVCDAERRNDDLAARRLRMLADLADTQAATARAARETAASQREQEMAAQREQAVQQRVKAATADREALVASATRLRSTLAETATVPTTGRAPRERETTKQEFGVMLKYGRIYLMHVFEDGDRIVNTEDFVVTKGIVHDTAEPKPHKGFDLLAGKAGTADIQRLLAAHPPDSWYPCLVVHPDSFVAFLGLKNFLVALGYEYRLMPTGKGVYDSGGSGGSVQ